MAESPDRSVRRSPGWTWRLGSCRAARRPAALALARRPARPCARLCQRSGSGPGRRRAAGDPFGGLSSVQGAALGRRCAACRDAAADRSAGDGAPHVRRCQPKLDRSRRFGRWSPSRGSGWNGWRKRSPPMQLRTNGVPSQPRRRCRWRAGRISVVRLLRSSAQ